MLKTSIHFMIKTLEFKSIELKFPTFLFPLSNHIQTHNPTLEKCHFLNKDLKYSREINKRKKTYFFTRRSHQSSLKKIPKCCSLQECSMSPEEHSTRRRQDQEHRTEEKY
ncbi:hypothetical protein Dsin_013668 [Dipteronia sinensis]|uniref:Uncharacterized protein n=1 Tax=Dipteronia sinensis TaxID=43782 RepID=A0AAE0E936_9ROSI|nr:hypothetical protein Dsin_013668 [Dipteronia sinensis]